MTYNPIHIGNDRTAFIDLVHTHYAHHTYWYGGERNVIIFYNWIEAKSDWHLISNLISCVKTRRKWEKFDALRHLTEIEKTRDNAPECWMRLWIEYVDWKSEWNTNTSTNRRYAIIDKNILQLNDVWCTKCDGWKILCTANWICNRFAKIAWTEMRIKLGKNDGMQYVWWVKTRAWFHHSSFSIMLTIFTSTRNYIPNVWFSEKWFFCLSSRKCIECTHISSPIWIQVYPQPFTINENRKSAKICACGKSFSKFLNSVSCVHLPEKPNFRHGTNINGYNVGTIWKEKVTTTVQLNRTRKLWKIVNISWGHEVHFEKEKLSSEMIIVIKFFMKFISKNEIGQEKSQSPSPSLNVNCELLLRELHIKWTIIRSEKCRKLIRKNFLDLNAI